MSSMLSHVEKVVGSIQAAYDQVVCDRQHMSDYLARQTERMNAHLKSERIKLENEMARVEALRARATAVQKDQNEVVVLNVGGTNFSTTLGTLRADPYSMLGAMFSGIYGDERNEDGSFFVDRSPDLFPYILSYLRTCRE
eukprot:gene20208-7254_t